MKNTTRLTESQIHAWQKDGYFLSDIIIEDSILEQMREHVDLVFSGVCRNEAPMTVTWKPGDDEDKIRQMANAWRTDPVLEASATTPEIGYIAAQLQQVDTIRLLMDWLVYKPGIGDKIDANTGVGWHQDQAYWLNTYPSNLLTARIPLDHETIENGCMSIIPGSHKWGLSKDLSQGFWKPVDDDLPGYIEKRVQGDHEIKVCELLPGQIMFHHCCLIHGSGQNRSDKPRRSQNIHMMPTGTKYRSLGPTCFLAAYAKNHGQMIKESQELTGDLFPTIYKAN